MAARLRAALFDHSERVRGRTLPVQRVTLTMVNAHSEHARQELRAHGNVLRGGLDADDEGVFLVPEAGDESGHWHLHGVVATNWPPREIRRAWNALSGGIEVRTRSVARKGEDWQSRSACVRLTEALKYATKSWPRTTLIDPRQDPITSGVMARAWADAVMNRDPIDRTPRARCVECGAPFHSSARADKRRCPSCKSRLSRTRPLPTAQASLVDRHVRAALDTMGAASSSQLACAIRPLVRFALPRERVRVVCEELAEMGFVVNVGTRDRPQWQWLADAP